MVAIPILLALLAVQPVGVQSEGAERVAVGPAPACSSPASAVEAAFSVEFEELRQVRERFARARIDARFAISERLPRFLDLARQGSGRAAAFVLSQPALDWSAEDGLGSLRQERALKLELYATIARSVGEALMGDAAWLTEPELDVFVSLRRDASLLGVQRARALARALHRVAPGDEGRARSLLLEAELELDGAGGEPSAERRARALLSQVLELHPTTGAAEAAADLLWRLDHLSPGQVAPDFVAQDVDGNELCLSDYDHRVVLVEFWSFEDPDVDRRLAARRILFERFREERFAIVGINLDSKEHAYRRAIEEFGVEWPSAYTGGMNGRVIWKVRGPATFVLAPGRVIQQVDLGEGRLEQVIERLIAEGKETGDSRASGSGPPIR